MVLRLRVRRGPEIPNGGPRRESIYPHRSVRYIGKRKARTIAAVVTAVLLTLAVAFNCARLMSWHAGLSDRVLGVAGIPVTNWETVPVYDALGSAPAPVTPVPSFQETPDAPRLLLIFAVVALMMVSRHWTLSRSLNGFLIVLLLASALLNSLYPDFRFSAQGFTGVWFRIETVVWLTLPWVSSLLFVMFQPGIAAGIGLAVFAQVYGFFFGVLRYTFFLGVMHHTGLLFFPVLWMALGLLANLLYLLVIYSLSIHRASARLWGERRTWI